MVVLDGDDRHELSVQPERTVRDALLDADLPPYTRLTERANCRGRGLCATCGVRLHDDTDPDHWHDALADRFGYPRLSCQIQIQDGLVVELDTEKRIWGHRE
ncbi:2Fe-2S iron-sulfur cluster-binding protein [Halorubellus sp. PRR65]|uniref:2Fe-2S iron-sulfur cluster-binding protein n=1 Tax=Halorubellus sp. PRR65 TaxID=3098148 RepID=UPI002B25E5E5|nr:2Fe-2S iron-sulfur cluster-binding protein [Halorubellus sp. PRR65]